jgi:hypothetical protein
MPRLRLPRIDFEIGEGVHLVVAEERRRGMVVGVTLRPGTAIYLVSWPDGSETGHYAIELTREFVPSFDAEAEADTETE